MNTCFDITEHRKIECKKIKKDPGDKGENLACGEDHLPLSAEISCVLAEDAESFALDNVGWIKKTAGHCESLIHNSKIF